MKKTNVVEYSDIFWFAETLGVEWNRCCDIFHSTEILPFQGKAEMVLRDLKSDLANNWNNIAHKPDWKQAYEILIAFMKKEKVSEMMVVGNG